MPAISSNNTKISLYPFFVRFTFIWKTKKNEYNVFCEIVKNRYLLHVNDVWTYFVETSGLLRHVLGESNREPLSRHTWPSPKSPFLPTVSQGQGFFSQLSVLILIWGSGGGGYTSFWVETILHWEFGMIPETPKPTPTLESVISFRRFM